MTNGAKNLTFLNRIDETTKNNILSNIAVHYQITNEMAFEEVTHEEAEHLLDYVTGNERNSVHILMQMHNCM